MISDDSGLSGEFRSKRAFLLEVLEQKISPLEALQGERHD
jgi:hypothetical protein